MEIFFWINPDHQFIIEIEHYIDVFPQGLCLQ